MGRWNAATIFEFRIRRDTFESPCDGLPTGTSDGDFENGVRFVSDVCGEAFGENVVATTGSWSRGNRTIQSNIYFNNAYSWGVYDGPSQTGQWAGTLDFGRFAVHELGHALGLGHADDVPAIMASSLPDGSTIVEPQADDIDGVAAIYRGSLLPATPRYIITTIAGTGESGFSGDRGPAVEASLVEPVGVAVDRGGNVYIADRNSHRIRRVDSTGTITTIAGTGESGFSGDGGSAVEAQLHSPHGVEVDRTGNIYIADSGNNRIRKVDSMGTITTIAGSGERGFSGDGGPAVEAGLTGPSDVAVDGGGNGYIAQPWNVRVRRVDSTGTITTIAGGDGLVLGDGGPAVEARLSNLQGVAVDGGGNVYIADTTSRRIRKVDSTGMITTIAGGGTSYADSGPAVEARLVRPFGVAVDEGGNVYITDAGDRRVRRIDSTGTITTIAGAGTEGFSGDGGPAVEARLSGPWGVAVDGGGNVYIADSSNRRIRKLTPSGGSESPDPTDPAAKPPNDLFSNALTILGLTGRATGSNVGATVEAGEPGQGTSSVWWQWKSSSNGTLTINTVGSSFDTTLAVYTGTRVDALMTLAENNDAVGRQSGVVLDVTAETVYRLQVAGFGGSEGSIVLKWNLEAATPPPGNAFMIFPQVADGAFPDGAFYRTTISLTRKGSRDTTCSLTLYGMDANLGNGRASAFTLTVPADGFVSARTAGDGPIQTGYATVGCDEEIYGQLTYAYYDASGTKIAEATVFPTEVESSSYDIIVDGRDGAGLGLAIANNTDLERIYDLTLRNQAGGRVSTGLVTVPARSNVAQFLNDLISPPPAPGNVHLLEVRASDFSVFSMIGLRFTGAVFSTVPAN